MTKLSFLQRFPHFGIILVIAIVLAIPLTIWSLNNVSTQTQQQAAGTCSSIGGTCTSSGICGAEGNGIISGGTCTIGQVCCRLDATPKSPSQVLIGSKLLQTGGYALVAVLWSNVTNATAYDLYYKYDYSSLPNSNTPYTVLTNVKYSNTPNDSSKYFNLYTLNYSAYIHAYVVAKNGTLKSAPSVVVTHKVNQYSTTLP